MKELIIFVLFLSAGCLAFPFWDEPCDACQSVWAEFKSGAITTSQATDDSPHHMKAISWEGMIKEAHNKFKFKDGKIFASLEDAVDKERMRRKTYYQTFRLSETTLFANNSGPDWMSAINDAEGVTSFDKMAGELMALGSKPAKNRMLAWTGSVKGASKGTRDHDIRPLLLQFAANTSKYFDFKDNDPSEGHKEHMSGLVENYAFLLDIGSSGYSTRLKFLLHSNRPVFLVDRMYVEYWQSLLQPYVHYIPVREDLVDLVEQFEWAYNNTETCARIAEAAQTFAMKHLTHSAFIDRVGEVVSYLLMDGH